MVLKSAKDAAPAEQNRGNALTDVIMRMTLVVGLRWLLVFDLVPLRLNLDGFHRWDCVS